MQYFGSIIVEGVAEAEMSWVEVDGAGWSWVHGLVIPIYNKKVSELANDTNWVNSHRRFLKTIHVLTLR